MSDFPTITGTQMAEVDRAMMHEIGVNTYQLMEVAGWQIARGAVDYLSTLSSSTGMQRILALAGTGGNGGDAMVAARLLTGWGIACTVALSQPRERYEGIAAHQLKNLDRLDIAVLEPNETTPLPDAELILDGLLGFSLRSDPRGHAATLIAMANDHPAPVLAIDVPSGLNADTGEVGSPCIRADRTITLALAKSGLASAPAEIIGELWLADIGVPPQIYARFGVYVAADTFRESSIVRLL